MNNKYLYMVVGAIIGAVWFYAAYSAYFANGASGISDNWWFAMIVAVVLGAGSTGGDNVVSIFVEGIKGYISTLVLLAIVFLVGYSVYTLAVTQAVPEMTALVTVVATAVASGFLTNMMMSYLKKANA